MLELKTLIESLTEQVLAEMPVASYKTIGDFSKGSSIRHPVDRKLLTHPKAIEKITKQWEKTPFEFDLFVINDKRVRSFVEIGTVGFQDMVRNKMKLTPEEVPDPNPGHITILFTNNSGDERYMASGWILAHRFGHALNTSRDVSGQEWKAFTQRLEILFGQILKDVYGVNLDRAPVGQRLSYRYPNEQILKYAAQQLGSMKSARDNNLRSWYEFAYELLAQYMLTGKITLNPLPEKMVVGLKGWGRKDTRQADSSTQAMYNNHDLEYYADELENMLEQVLAMAVGNVYVM